jgi:hypothetical protein
VNVATPEQLDEVAASLAKAYGRAGVFCAIVRTAGESNVRVIAPQRDIAQTSEFLRMAAEVLFNGPATIRYPKA